MRAVTEYGLSVEFSHVERQSLERNTDKEECNPHWTGYRGMAWLRNNVTEVTLSHSIFGSSVLQQNKQIKYDIYS